MSDYEYIIENEWEDDRYQEARQVDQLEAISRQNQQEVAQPTPFEAVRDFLRWCKEEYNDDELYIPDFAYYWQSYKEAKDHQAVSSQDSRSHPAPQSHDQE